MITDDQLMSEFDLEEAPRKAMSNREQLEAMKIGLQMRSQAYREVFNYDSPAAFTVLQDLAWVCRANRSLFVLEPIRMAHLTGMHDIWLRIQHHVALTPTQLVALYSDVFKKEGFGR